MNKSMRVFLILLGVVAISMSPCTGSEELPIESHPATDVYDGWRLGVQLWSFHRFTFYEAVDKTASLGLDWIEAFPNGQKLSRDKRGVIFGHDMSPG